MQLSLPPDLERFVQALVASGAYDTPEEVVQDALRMLQDQEESRLEQLRREIQIGIDQLDRGESVSHNEHSLRQLIDEIKAEGRRAADQRKAKQA